MTAARNRTKWGVPVQRLSKPPTLLQNGVAATNLSGPAGSDRYFAFDIPDGQGEIDFTTAGGGGDVDMYIAQDALPTDSEFLCGSRNPGTNLETCHGWNLVGRWYVRVRGTTDYSGVSLQVTAANASRILLGEWRKNLAGARG